MARPIRAGLEYFSVDVDIFEDDKLYDVQLEYGPLGEVIYLRLLCLIYKNGYYYRFDNLDKLAGMLIKSIGNRWVRNKQAVIDVILFLVKINLFSAELMQENVLTSRSIQARFQKANERNLRKIEQYNLLEKTESREGLKTAPQKSVNVTENAISAAETEVSVYNNPPKKSKEKEKEKEIIVKERKEEVNSADALPSPSSSIDSFSFAADAAADYADANLISARDSNQSHSSANAINASAPATTPNYADKSANPINPPVPAKRSSQDELREALVRKYGEYKVTDYEIRYVRWQTAKGITGDISYNAIARWIMQDNAEREKTPTYKPDPISSFNRDSSFDINEVEQQILDRYRKLPKSNSTDEELIAQINADNSGNNCAGNSVVDDDDDYDTMSIINNIRAKYANNNNDNNVNTRPPTPQPGARMELKGDVLYLYD